MFVLLLLVLCRLPHLPGPGQYKTSGSFQSAGKKAPQNQQFLKNHYGNDFMTPSNTKSGGNDIVGIDGKSPSLKSIPKIVKRKKKKFARNGMKRLLYGF